MKLTMLGTGNAQAIRCYNTCFLLEENGRRLLVDGGGGNGILLQLDRLGLKTTDLREIFVTHKHADHILGIVWIMRMLATAINKGEYEGSAAIYAHDEAAGILKDLAASLLQAKQARHIGDRIQIITLRDGDSFELIGHRARAFDIRSTKAKQFGFCLYYGDNRKLCCCGDEPYNECAHEYAQNSDWLLHEAFCLSSQADIFKPYEKHHSTVKDACQTAQALGAKNLVLYHTEDKNLAQRKALYTAEGEQYFTGRLFVPDDLESIDII